MAEPPDSLGKDQGRRDAKGRWRPGVSGCPSGPPKGTRHKATRIAEALIDGQAEALVGKAIQMGLQGDATVLKAVLDRLLPPRRDRPVDLDLPQLKGVEDLARVTATLLGATASGELSPGEASEISKLVEAHRKATETVDLERRLAALEQALQQGNRG
jgi:hypothetical protein